MAPALQFKMLNYDTILLQKMCLRGGCSEGVTNRLQHSIPSVVFIAN